MTTIVFDNFPIPPSSNAIYRSFFNKKIGRLVHYKSKELKAYQVLVDSWASNRSMMIAAAKHVLESGVRDHMNSIRVDAYFGLKRSRLWTRENTRKKIDVSNRIKALHDTLSTCLGIDDRFFFPGDCEPVVVADLMEDECVLIKMTVKPPRLMGTIKKELKQELQLPTTP